MFGLWERKCTNVIGQVNIIVLVIIILYSYHVAVCRQQQAERDEELKKISKRLLPSIKYPVDNDLNG